MTTVPLLSLPAIPLLPLLPPLPSQVLIFALQLLPRSCASISDPNFGLRVDNVFRSQNQHLIWQDRWNQSLRTYLPLYPLPPLPLSPSPPPHPAKFPRPYTPLIVLSEVRRNIEGLPVSGVIASTQPYPPSCACQGLLPLLLLYMLSLVQSSSCNRFVTLPFSFLFFFFFFFASLWYWEGNEYDS